MTEISAFITIQILIIGFLIIILLFGASKYKDFKELVIRLFNQSKEIENMQLNCKDNYEKAYRLNAETCDLTEYAKSTLKETKKLDKWINEALVPMTTLLKSADEKINHQEEKMKNIDAKLDYIMSKQEEFYTKFEK